MNDCCPDDLPVTWTEAGPDSDGRRVLLLDAVRPDGTPGLWVIRPDLPAGDPVTTPAHEEAGPLPYPIRQRMRPTCGAPVAHGDGPTCRRTVPTAGDRCYQHREPEPETGPKLAPGRYCLPPPGTCYCGKCPHYKPLKPQRTEEDR